MRIALATTSLAKHGGAASFQDHLAAQLRDAGNQVTQYRIGRTDEKKGRIICVDKDCIKRPDEEFIAEERLTCGWEDLWERNDLVHITNPGSLHLGFNWDQLFATKHGPLALTIHDPHEIEVLGPTLIELCKTADLVTFLSPRYLEHFVSAGYVDAEIMRLKAVYVRQPYVRRNDPARIFEKARRVVCTSGWRPVKRIDLIVKAAEFLPVESGNVKPLEFWSGDGVAYVEDMVENLPGMANCEDHGEWDDEQMDDVYGTAGAVVNMTMFDESDTGRTEYPILEAWDYQVMPVIGTDFAGDAEFGQLQPGFNCFTAEPTPEAVAARIIDALDNPKPPAYFAKSLEPHEDAGRDYLAAYEEAIARCVTKE